jgi:hypothetical protein
MHNIHAVAPSAVQQNFNGYILIKKKINIEYRHMAQNIAYSETILAGLPYA